MINRALHLCFFCLAVVPWAWWKLFSLLLGKEKAFQGASQCCALFPGKFGERIRAVFYRLSLDSSQRTTIGFLSTFSDTEATLGAHVSTGVCCNIGKAMIGDHCTLGSFVCIASERNPHDFSDTDTPIGSQEGEKTLVRIGRDCWLGTGCVILADIGQGSVVEAGSVVTKSVPEYSVAVGNPARVVKTHLEPGRHPDQGISGMANDTPLVMQMTVTLRMGGAERLALSLLRQGRERFSGIVAGLFQNAGDLAEAANDLGFPSIALHAESRGKLGGILHVYRTLRRNRISLLHIQAAYLLPYALPAAKLAGIPVVYTEHALHSLQTKPVLRTVVKLSAPFLLGIVCVSRHVADYFITELGVSARKVQVIENGVDTDLFAPEGESMPLPWPEEAGCKPFVFGNVSRLTEAKDHENLLRAFSLVRQKHPHVRLLLAGEGEERPGIEKLIASLGIAEYTYMAGACGNVPAVLRSLDSFVLSSRREGMPMAVLEAMACGLPVVSTEVGDMAALNRDGECVMLVPTETPTALAAAMERLVENAAMRQDLAERGRNHVLASRSSATMAEQYFSLYRKGGLI